MFELDDKFFEEVGVDQMPAAEKKAFKEHVQEEMEVRVGERISDGMTTEKMAEFEQIIDDKPGYISSWLAQYSPDYANDQIYQALSAQSGDDANVLSEYAAMKWLSINRPDFTQVIAGVMQELKQELQANAKKIVG